MHEKAASEAWEEECEDINEDLLGNPFDLEDAFSSMMFPVSPLSKAGQRKLVLAQKSMRQEREKKRNRRRTLDIFEEQFGDNTSEEAFSLLKADEEDELLKKQTDSAKKPRFSSFKSSVFPKRQSPTFLRVPQLPASRLVLPTKLKTPAKVEPVKRIRADDKKFEPSKRLQSNIPVPTKSPSKSRIPVRQAV